MALKYSDEEMLEGLKKFAGELGKTPSINDFRKYNPDYLASARTYVQRFGRYALACKCAGLEPNPAPHTDFNRQKTKEELLDELRYTIDILGRVPSVKETRILPFLSCRSHYSLRFGSWSNALDELGEYPEPSVWDKRYSLHLLEAKTKELARKPKYQEIQEDDRLPSTTYYQKEFGTLENALSKTQTNIGLLEFWNDLGFNPSKDWIEQNTSKLIKMYYGLCGYDSHTLKEVGDNFHITKQGVDYKKSKEMEELKCQS